MEEVRDKIRRLINAEYVDEIVFTRNTTEGVNLLANALPLEKNDTVLCSDLEHNSNLLPWQRLARNGKNQHKVFHTNPDTTFNAESFVSSLDSSVRLISVVHTSNLTGTTLPVEQIIRIAHERECPVLVDASQSIPTGSVDVQQSDVDFMVFSMHKAYGPTGVGILYGKRKWLQELEPLLLGGESVDDSTYETHTLARVPHRFEAGLQNYAGIVGTGAAEDFLSTIDSMEFFEQITQLNAQVTEALANHPRIRILGPSNPERRGAIVNFIVDGIPSKEVADLLDRGDGILVRPGKHCVHSWYNDRGHPDSVRISFGVYNDSSDADRLVEAVGKLVRFF